MFLQCKASQEISHKNRKRTRGVHFTISPARPCATKFYETRHTRSSHRDNHVCQIFSRSFQGLRSSDTPELPFPKFRGDRLIYRRYIAKNSFQYGVRPPSSICYDVIILHPKTAFYVPNFMLNFHGVRFRNF